MSKPNHNKAVTEPELLSDTEMDLVIEKFNTYGTNAQQ